MRAESLLNFHRVFHLVLPRWTVVAALLVAALALVLLALAGGVIGDAGAAPVDGLLVGPFRWVEAPHMG